MNNETVSTKKKVGGTVLDILTIGMLFAAFGAIFYSGFIVESSNMPLSLIAAVTALGLLLLFCIGTVSCMVTKVKNHSLTAGFLAFSAIQLCALIVNFTVLLFLMIKLFTVQDILMQVGYAVTTAIVLIGYVASIAAYSDGILDDTVSDEEESDAEVDGEDVSDGETADEEISDEAASDEEMSDEDASDEETSDEEISEEDDEEETVSTDE